MNQDIDEKSKESTYEEQLRDLYNSKKFEEALQLVLDEEQRRPRTQKILAAKSTLFGILGKYNESIYTANEALSLNIETKLFNCNTEENIRTYNFGEVCGSVKSL